MFTRALVSSLNILTGPEHIKAFFSFSSSPFYSLVLCVYKYTTLSISSYLVLTLEYKAINHGNQVMTSQSENEVEASCYLAFKRARDKGRNNRSLSKEFSDHIVCLSLLHHGHFCY